MTEEKKEKTIEISSLTLNIGKRELVLTLDEARKLKDALNNLFKAETVHHWHYDYFLNKPKPYYNPFMGQTMGLGDPGMLVGQSMADKPKYSLTCDVNKMLDYVNPQPE